MDRPNLRAIVDLLPRYAHAHRAGWTPVRIPLPDYLPLRRIAIERDDGPVPYTELRANALDPYRTIDPFLDRLPRLDQVDWRK